MAGEQISRRQFLKDGATVLGYLALAGLLEKEKNEFDLDWLEHPEHYRFQLGHNSLPSDNQGIFVNTPFLYLADDEATDRLLLSLGPWTKGVRVFLDDRYEQKLGEYNEDVLSRLITYGKKLEAMGKTLQVDLFDGFTMRQTWNPVYGSNGATSPYAVVGSEAFYGDRRYIDAFVSRIRSILPIILAISNLSAVSVANELVPSAGKQGRLEFAAWYQRIVDEIRRWSIDIPIYSGVASPSLLPPIAGLTANTAHLYPFLGVEQELMNDGADSPIVVQEVGATNTYFGHNLPVSHDEIFSLYLRFILSQTSSVNRVNRIVTLSMATLYPWKLDNYVDGFHFDETFEKTNDILVTMAGIYGGLT